MNPVFLINLAVLSKNSPQANTYTSTVTTVLSPVYAYSRIKPRAAGMYHPPDLLQPNPHQKPKTPQISDGSRQGKSAPDPHVSYTSAGFGGKSDSFSTIPLLQQNANEFLRVPLRSQHCRRPSGRRSRHRLPTRPPPGPILHVFTITISSRACHRRPLIYCYDRVGSAAPICSQIPLGGSLSAMRPRSKARWHPRAGVADIDII